MLQGETYYSGEQMGQCQFCAAITDVRESFCFACADAQTIIGTGSDMYDRTVADYKKFSHPDGDGVHLPVVEVNKRLHLLIKNGWRPPQENVERENTSPNSRYATALDVLREYGALDNEYQDEVTLQTWLEERLNAK